MQVSPRQSLVAILLHCFAGVGCLVSVAGVHAQTWTKIADEGGNFSFSGTKTVRYGAGSSWIQTSITGSGGCTNAFFGGDPIQGVVKECDAYVQAQTWTKIADEGGNFSFSGTKTVRYGAGNSFIQTSITGSGSCTNGFFGNDPIQGVVKECDVLSSAPLASTLSLTSSVNPVTVGQTTVLSAQITPTSATGSVVFNDGATVIGTVALSAGSATLSGSFSAPGTHTLSVSFAGDADVSSSSSVPLSQNVVSPSSCSVPANGSFETPSVAASGGYVYNVSGGTWVFNSQSGITGNASAFTGNGPDAPDGVQVAFIQGAGTVSQALTLAAGTYTLSYKAVQRISFGDRTQIVRASLDGATLGSFQPTDFGYTSSPPYTFTVAAGTHTLQLAGVGTGNDFTAFVDSVCVTSSATGSLPSPPVSPTPEAHYEYDAQGNPTKTVVAPNTSGFAFATTSGYDALNRQKTIFDAKAGITQLAYDGMDRTTQVTDPRNLVTGYVRNGLGDTTSLSSPDTGVATQTFDAAGNLKTRLDSRNVLATFSYDALNRPTSLVYSQNGQASLSYGWTYDQTGAGFSNGVGKLTSTAHPNGTSQYAYDPQGRMVTDIQRVSAASGANAAQVSTTVTYGHDTTGHVTSIVYPSGRMLSVAYTDGQPTALSLAKDTASTAVPLISAVQWEPFGGVKSWQWQLASSTQVFERLYDASGRLVRYRLGDSIRDLTYDAADRITTYTHYDANTGAAKPSLDQSFGYDELGRLIGITTAGASWTIGYDANGNRTGVTRNGTTSVYTTASTNNQLVGITNPTRNFGYDNAGNTLTDTGGYTSTYDLSGRMATLTKAGTTAIYTVDATGRRVRKFTSAGSGSTVIFVYDQQGQLLGEYDSSGAVLREYVWLGSMPVAMFTNDTVAANAPLVYFIHSDHLNTPRVVVDKNTAARWTWLAEPFGTSAPDTNPANLGLFTQNLRFPGQYFDQESGLHYNYFRDYDTSLGRYVQSDPIGLAGGVNTYAYVDGNPVSFFDRAGLDRWGAATAPAVVLTFQKEGRTLFYDPATERMFSIPTNSAVAKSSKPGASGPYSGLVTMCQRGKLGKAYGTAKLRTTDSRSRWVHGGGSRSPNPYAPEQGWYPTEGCTRAQNEDIEDICSAVEEYQETNYPNGVILYRRD